MLPLAAAEGIADPLQIVDVEHTDRRTDMVVIAKLNDPFQLLLSGAVVQDTGEFVDISCLGQGFIFSDIN